MLSCRNALNSPFPSRATGAADEEAKLFTHINISNNPSIGIVLLLSEIAIIIGAFAHMKSAKRLQEQQQSDSASPLTNVDTNTELDNLCARLESSLDGLKAQKMFGGYFVAFRGVAQMESALNDLRRTSYDVLMSVDVVKSMTASRVDSETKAALEQALDLVQEQPVEDENVRFEDAREGKSSLFLPSRVLEARAVSFEDICDWESWDLFEFAASADPGALFPLLFEAVADRGLDSVSELQLSRTGLGKLLQDAQRTYESAGRMHTTLENSSLDLLNAYHHSLHGADVLCTTAVMLTKLPDAVTGTQGLSALTKFSCCMASIIHDYGHGGLPNRFLNQLMTKASVTYSDDSTLERLHLALAFELIYESHILDTLSQQQRQLFRKTVVSLVLSTVSPTALRTRPCSRSRLFRTQDLANGFKTVAAVKATPVYKAAALRAAHDGWQEEKAEHDSVTKISPTLAPLRLPEIAPEQLQTFLNLVVECADVSHAAKPFVTHLRWSMLVTQEFLKQGAPAPLALFISRSRRFFGFGANLRHAVCGAALSPSLALSRRREGAQHGTAHLTTVRREIAQHEPVRTESEGLHRFCGCAQSHDAVDSLRDG